MFPVAPIPPVTTNVPVVVLELALLAVNTTALLAANVVNAPLALVVEPMAMLLILLALVGASVTVPAVILTTAEPPLIVTSPEILAVVAVNILPSSLITI